MNLTTKLSMHFNFGGGKASRVEDVLIDGKKTGITIQSATKSGKYTERFLHDAIDDQQFNLLDTANRSVKAREWIESRLRDVPRVLGR